VDVAVSLDARSQSSVGLAAIDAAMSLAPAAPQQVYAALYRYGTEPFWSDCPVLRELKASPKALSASVARLAARCGYSAASAYHEWRIYGAPSPEAWKLYIAPRRANYLKTIETILPILSEKGVAFKVSPTPRGISRADPIVVYIPSKGLCEETAKRCAAPLRPLSPRQTAFAAVHPDAPGLTYARDRFRPAPQLAGLQGGSWRANLCRWITHIIVTQRASDPTGVMNALVAEGITDAHWYGKQWDD